jgi:hypothetical protein
LAYAWRRGRITCAVGMGFVALLALVMAIQPTRAASDNYRYLRFGGAPVKWRQPTAEMQVQLSYAIATKPAYDEEAINCGRIGPIDSLLESSGLTLDAFRDALQIALRRWERAANIVFVATTDEDTAGTVIGAQLRPRGIAYANVSLGKERSGEHLLIERSRVCLNPERRWKVGFDGNLDVYDLVHTLTHEVGHAIGLDHPSGDDNVMSFEYRETRTGLSAGDIMGVRGMYGAPLVEVAGQRPQMGLHIGALR